jgi:hypothetical protein
MTATTAIQWMYGTPARRNRSDLTIDHAQAVALAQSDNHASISFANTFNRDLSVQGWNISMVSIAIGFGPLEALIKTDCISCFQACFAIDVFCEQIGDERIGCLNGSAAPLMTPAYST